MFTICIQRKCFSSTRQAVHVQNKEPSLCWVTDVLNCFWTAGRCGGSQSGVLSCLGSFLPVAHLLRPSGSPERCCALTPRTEKASWCTRRALLRLCQALHPSQRAHLGLTEPQRQPGHAADRQELFNMLSPLRAAFQSSRALGLLVTRPAASSPLLRSAQGGSPAAQRGRFSDRLRTEPVPARAAMDCSCT